MNTNSIAMCRAKVHLTLDLILIGLLTITGVWSQSCRQPDWFVPYGIQEGDTVWQGGTDEVLDLPQHVQYTPFGLSGGDDVQAIVKASPLGVVQLSSRRNYVTLHTARPPAETYVLDGFQSAVFIGQRTDNDTLSWATNHLAMLEGTGDVYPAVRVDLVLAITYHCLRLQSRPTQMSTFQVVLVFDGPRLILFYNIASLVFGDSPSITYINPGNIPDAETINLVSDAQISRDPNAYTKSTNMRRPFLTTPGNKGWNNEIRNGHWGVFLSSNPPYIPEILNPWGPWTCADCGGCGQRSRMVNGRKEYDFGPCSFERKCSIVAHSRVEKYRDPKGRLIKRMRRCCYDYRYSPPIPLPEPEICYHVNGWDWPHNLDNLNRYDYD